MKHILGGNIGYKLHDKHHSKKFGTLLLSLALDLSYQYGIKKVSYCVNIKNKPSINTTLSCGAKFLFPILMEDDNETYEVFNFDLINNLFN